MVETDLTLRSGSVLAIVAIMFGKRNRITGEKPVDRDDDKVIGLGAPPPMAPPVTRLPGSGGSVGDLGRILAAVQEARAAAGGRPDAVAVALRQSFGTDQRGDGG